MHEVKLGKEYYHFHHEMLEWVRNNISANGGWRFGAYEIEKQNWLWDIEVTFGNTHFRFINEADALFFTCRWK